MIEFDLALHRGEFRLNAALASNAHVIGLFGPSGSGKSTLLNVLAGSLRPARGRIVINGRCLFDSASGLDVPIHRRRIGVVYQEGRLFPHLSVKHNLNYGMHWLKAAQRRFDLDAIVDMLEIGHLVEQRPAQLSGGERQRVALGRALLSSPELLLFDEPMASLDERLKSQILPFLRRVKEEVEIPMIYVSHAIQEILALTSQVAVIKDGAILGCGDFHDVMACDTVLPLAQSLGIENVLPVTLAASHADLGYSEGVCGGHTLILPLSDGEQGALVYLVVPASQIALARAPVPGTSIQNQPAGRVTGIRVVGHRALVTIDIGLPLTAEVSEKSLHDLGIEVGQTLHCMIKAQALRNVGPVRT